MPKYNLKNHRRKAAIENTPIYKLVNVISYLFISSSLSGNFSEMYLNVET